MKHFNNYIYFLISIILFIHNDNISAQIDYNYERDYKKDSGFKYQKTLTDQEVVDSKKFIHNGLIQRLYDKECQKKDDDTTKRKDICSGGLAPSLTGKTGDIVIETVAKMYGVFFSPSMLGEFKIDTPLDSMKNNSADKAKVKPTDVKDQDLRDSTTTNTTDNSKDSVTKPPDDTPQKTKEKNQNDYCALGPTVTETGSGMYFAIQDENEKAKNSTIIAQQGEQAVGQSEKLFQYAKQYEYKQIAGRLNSAGWAATTTCYIAQSAIVGPHLVNGTYWLRPVAAAGITAYWSAKAGFFGFGGGVYEDYIKISNLLGNSLRGLKGACNPITEKECYCAQPETRYDPKYCMPQILQARAKLQAESGPVGVCVDDKLQEDPQCKCLDSNTCFDVKYNKIAAPFFGPGIAQTNSLLNNIQKISRGDIQGLSRNQISIDNLRNALNKALSQRKPLAQYPSFDSLSDKQKKEARTFLNMGIPEDLANTMAAMPLGEAGKKFLKDHGQNSDQSLTEFLAKQRIGDDEGAGYAESTHSMANNRPDSSVIGASSGKKEASGTEIRNYQKLINAADIPKNNDESIFVRVSKRVHNSFWSVLDQSVFDITRPELKAAEASKPVVVPDKAP